MKQNTTVALFRKLVEFTGIFQKKEVILFQIFPTTLQFAQAGIHFIAFLH